MVSCKYVCIKGMYVCMYVCIVGKIEETKHIYIHTNKGLLSLDIDDRGLFILIHFVAVGKKKNFVLKLLFFF